MPQYRLTERFAKDCQIKATGLPEYVIFAMDDWVLDILAIKNNKIVMATHVKTLCTLLAPYDLVGGPMKALEYIPQLFGQFLLLCGYPPQGAAQAFRHLSEQPQKFCKTNNRSVLGFMNDFKKAIVYHLEEIPFENIHWGNMIQHLSEIPVNIKGMGFTTPRELLDGFLNHRQLVH
jgi:hypothetical protein